MTNWEYKYLQILNDRQGFVRRLNEELNELGASGWEFTGHVITADAWDYYFMKREAVQTASMGPGRRMWLADDGTVMTEPEFMQDTVIGLMRMDDGTMVAIHEPVVEEYHFDTAYSDMSNLCGICGVHGNHDGVAHGDALGDNLTRDDIIGYLNGRGFRKFYERH